VVFSFHPYLAGALGWRGELACLVALAVLALPLHVIAVPGGRPRRPTQEREARLTVRPTMPLISLAGSWMFFFGAFASVFTFAPEWAGGGAKGLLVVTAITWVSLLVNPLVGHLIDRLGRPAAWAGGGLLLLAGILLVMALDHPAPLAAMLVVGLAAASVPTAVYSLPTRLMPASRIGFAFGFITAFSNLGTIAGPAAAGALRDASAGWSIPWLVLSVAAVLGALSLLPLRPSRTPPHI